MGHARGKMRFERIFFLIFIVSWVTYTKIIIYFRVAAEIDPGRRACGEFKIDLLMYSYTSACHAKIIY